MKKIANALMILATVAVSFVSCTKEINVQENVSSTDNMKTITVKTVIDTRTTLDANHQNLIWSTGDKISIFNDVNQTNSEEEYEAGGDIIVSVPEETEEIYAHYPYFSGNNNGPESVSVYINPSQTQKNPGELNGYNYPMVAKGTVTADNKAIILFSPVASALALNIYHTGLSGTEIETVNSVTVTPSNNTGYIGSQITDLTGNNVLYTSAQDSGPITVTLTNPLTLGNTKPADKQTFPGQIYICLAKQSYSGVTFVIQTNKGTYTITSNSVPFDCENNDFVPVNINLNSSSATFTPTLDYYYYEWNLVTSTSQIGVGAEVAIAAMDANYAMSQYQKTSNRDQSLITKSGTKMTWKEEDEVQIFEVVAGTDANSFGFKCANGTQKGKYIYAASKSSNHLKSQADLDANASWKVLIDASDNAATLTAQGENSRNTIRYNSSDKLFSCYDPSNITSTIKDVVLYIRGDALKSPVSAPTNVQAIATDNTINVTWVDASEGVDHYVVTCTAQTAVNVNPGVQSASFTNLSNGYYTVTIQAIAADHDTYEDSQVVTVEGIQVGSITKGAAWSYTFTSSQFSESDKTKTLNGRSWTMAGTGGSYFAYDGTKGQQFGSSSKPYSSLTLTSSFGSDYGVESVRVETSGASSINATVSVSVGGTALKCNNSTTKSLTSTSTAYTFESTGGLLVGQIVISFVQESSKAIYVKSLAVNSDGAAVNPETLLMSDITCTNSSQNETSLSFSWSAVEHASGYKVSTDGGNTYGATQSVTTYTWNGLTAGTTYTLYVKAIGDGTVYLDSEPKNQSGTTKTAQVPSSLYTLIPIQNSSNSAYATNYDVTINGISWNAPGNQNFNGYWRIGGKNLSNVSRVIYGKSSISGDVNEIVISTNGVSNASLTVNSITVKAFTSASNAASGNSPYATFTTSDNFNFSVSTTKSVTFALPNGINSCSGKYYRIEFNVSNNKDKNYGLDLTSITFNHN